MEHVRRCKLLVGKEVSREGREVAGGGIGVPLTSGTVESQNNDRATPRLLGLNAASYALDSIVNRRPPGQRERAIENMQRIAQRFSIQPLGEDDGVRLAFGEVLLNDRCRAGRSINYGAVDFHGARAIIAR